MTYHDPNKYIIVDYPLRPWDKGSNISTGDANHLRGGYHIVENEKIHEEQSIPDGIPQYDELDDEDIPNSNIRRIGMLVFVTSTGNTFRLEGGVSDDHWVLVKYDKSRVIYIEHTKEEIITHNLNKKPAVQIFDQNDQKCIATVTHINDNQTKINFEDFFTGRITFN